MSENRPPATFVVAGGDCPGDRWLLAAIVLVPLLLCSSVFFYEELVVPVWKAVNPPGDKEPADPRR